MVTESNVRFSDREVSINGNIYLNVSGEVFVNFDRESLTFTCDYCKLKGVAKENKAAAENFIKRQFEAFVLSDAIAAKEGEFIKFEYANKEDLNVERY